VFEVLWTFELFMGRTTRMAPTPRLTYRRRAGGWSASRMYKFLETAERKRRAAVRCRRLVSHSGLSQSSDEYFRETRTTVWKAEA
jgi:hypothetical protein